MKRLIIIVLFLFIGLIVAAQALRPMSVANTLRGTNGLLSIRPSTNQTTIVLGENAAGDSSARFATHAASWGATNNTDIFDAIGGGQWKLVSAGGSSSPPSTNSGTVVSVDGTYGATVNVADTAEIDGTLTGTNMTFALKSNAVSSNKMDAAVITALNARGLGTNLVVNGTMQQPARLTNAPSATTGGLRFVINGNGDIEGYATNFPASGGGYVIGQAVTNIAGTQYIAWSITNSVAYPVLTEPNKFYDYYDDLNWAALPTTGPIVTTANGAGAGASIVASETNACGIVRLSTGTTATGNNRLQLGATSTDSIVFGTNNFSKFEFRARLPVLSNGTDRYIARGGFYDATSGNATDGAYFEYTDNVNSGNWVAKVYSNSSLQSSNLIVGPSATAWQKLEVQVDGFLGYAYFFVDGTLQATITTGIPLGAARGTGTRIVIESTVGANADLMEIDYVHIEQFYTPAR